MEKRRDGTHRFLTPRLWTIISIFCLAAGLMAAYQLEIVDLRAHAGHAPIAWTLKNVSLATAATLLVALLLPTRLKKPSDFFTFFYGIIIMVPYSVFHALRAPVAVSEFLLYFCLLILPLLLIKFSTKIVRKIRLRKIRIPYIYTNQKMIYILMTISLLGIVLAFTNAPASAGFGISDVYTRRLEGRLAYPAGTLRAYLNMMIVNGIAPLLAFYAGWRFKVIPLVFSLFCVLSFYYLIGLKAPVFFAALTCLLGFLAQHHKIYRVTFWFNGVLLLVFCIFIFELVLTNYSYTADYFIRRVFVIPAEVLTAYFDFLFKSQPSLWSQQLGSQGDIPVTYLIGKLYFNNPEANVNTNTFILDLAEHGWIKYFFTLCLVSSVFVFFDTVYRQNCNKLFFCIALIFTLLILEQAATTALLSSGIGVLAILFYFTKPDAIIEPDKTSTAHDQNH